ncbi:MAG: AI-2E family transporter [Nanoarchaeota archaeon]|nr:AI-2E family transporter [Nanoarchaeota archaeon]
MKREETQTLQIGWQTFWRALFAIFFVYLIFQARHALGVFFVAVVLSMGIDPAVGFFEKRLRFNRLLATVLLFLFGAGLLGGALFLTLPVVVGETIGFLGDFNEALSSLFGVALPSAFVRDISTNLSKLVTFLGESHISLSFAVSRILAPIIFFLATIVVAFYLCVEKRGTEHLLRVILPDAYEEPTLRVFERFKKKIRRWLGAQLVLSVIVGFVVALGLWVLGVRYPLVLGILAGLFEVVPIIGPILAGLFAVIVAFSESSQLSFYVALFFIVVQQLENHILIPIVMGKTMKVHPVIVTISLLAGGQVAGFIGIFLAVPIAVLSQEIFTYMAEAKEKRAGQ